jgi:hypothetical protein
MLPHARWAKLSKIALKKKSELSSNFKKKLKIIIYTLVLNIQIKNWLWKFPYYRDINKLYILVVIYSLLQLEFEPDTQFEE